MHRRGWRRFLSVLGAVTWTAACGCGHDAEASKPDAAAEASSEAGKSFGSSDCLACISASCALQMDACRSTPECAAYLGCLNDCPENEEGNVEAECEAECSKLVDAEAIAAKGGLDACRLHGAGSVCGDCGGLGPDGGYPGDPILDQQCGPSAATEPCDKCLMEHCCETEAACEASSECGDMRSCFETYPVGAGLLARSGACVYTLCLVPGACEPALEGCLACTQEKCTESFARCFEDPECYLILHCVPECGNDVVCQQACIDAYSPDAGARFDAYATCLFSRCSGCG